MRAILCKDHGPPEDLVIEDIETAEPGDHDLVVGVKATALNFFDTLIIENKYQYKPELPFSPGAEVAGEVLQIGAAVTEFNIGDRVMGYLGYGGCREVVIRPAAKFTAMADGLEFTKAAGLTVTYGTTLHALQDRAQLSDGDVLVVLGAAGGTGQAAIEIGRIMGARVIACASSDEKLEFCRALGADEIINYATENLKDRIKELTGGKGADVVYDPVGGQLAEQAVRALAWEGKFLVVGFASGEIPRIPLNLVLLKGCQLVGVFWGSFTERSPDLFRAQLGQLMTWCAEGRLKPHIHKVYPLEKTAEALGALARREVKGKVIIQP